MARNGNSMSSVLAFAAIIISAFALYQIGVIQGGGGSGTTQPQQVADAKPTPTPTPTPAAAPTAAPVEVSVDDDPMMGDEDAPVTIIEFSDYECPFCARFFRDTYPQIKANYVETGKVKYVFRDFPLGFHAGAKPAANAAECIREQGGDEMYFEYHDVLFQNQPNFGTDNLKTYAADFDINQADFDACVDEQRYFAEADEDMAQGSAAGVRGTPGFFINGVLLSGAQPYASFQAAIEKALNE